MHWPNPNCLDEGTRLAFILEILFLSFPQPSHHFVDKVTISYFKGQQKGNLLCKEKKKKKEPSLIFLFFQEE